jgi:hypothetical protein
MQTEKPPSNPISVAALKIYDRPTLEAMSRASRMTLGSLIANLLEDYPEPTQAQLEGVKDKFQRHFTMSAFAPSFPLSDG